MSKKIILRSLLVVVLLSGFWTMVRAARLEVTTRQDNVPGSLRAAITTANSNNEDDTIYLPTGTYTLGGAAGEDENAGGDLDINTFASIIIIGSGPEITIIDGNEVDRVLHILDGTVSIIGVSIGGGKLNCPSGDFNPGEPEVEHGGGIYNNGHLTLKNCTVSNNVSKSGCYSPSGGWNYTSGGHGGGIYNAGTLTLANCTISNNKAGGGITDYTTTTAPGDGGGIYNAGTLYLTDCQVTGNVTSDGCSGRVPKNGGFGAGIYNSGTINLTRSTIHNNTTGSGGGGIQIWLGGSGGFGGGIFNDQGKAVLDYCTISSNKTGDGGLNYTPGDGGYGGGIYNTGTLILNNSTVIDNSTGEGDNSVEGSNGGKGGGICSISDSASLTNCTIGNNTTGKGKGTIEGGTPCRGGNGAGIYNSAGLTLKSCTIADNITGAGEENAISGFGGGIYNEDSGTVHLLNTIVANNQVSTGGEGPDCWGSLSSLGYNLVENKNNCTIKGNLTSNITGVDPQLKPLANNGGPTKTYALLSNSPAVDAGSGAGVTIDQRGYVRPIDINGITNANDGSDIGAFEYKAVSLPEISLNQTVLNFGAVSEGSIPAAQTLVISNSGSGTLQWTVNPDAAWLKCSPLSGTGLGEVSVRVETQGLSTGSYLGTITVESTQAINSPQTVTVILKVYPISSGLSPFGSFDTPLEGSTVMGGVPVTGWVLDDIGTESVKIYRKPLPGEGSALVYIGDAVFVEGARTDIQKAYPNYPNNYSAGWGYMMLTNLLPNQGNGKFTIIAKAADIEGNIVTLGEKTIICDNANAVKPFGAIDTPKQGGTASGSSYINFGWALTPLPNTIPKDGSTIIVWVDGVAVGHPVYNQYREDVAALFPGYNNSDGAVGYYYLDTTPYENGVHTIAWSVTDDAGNTEGIGSRYFTIGNQGQAASQANPATSGLQSIVSINHYQNQIPLENFEPIHIKKGYNQDIDPQVLYPDDSGNITIETRELERVEILLNAPLSTSSECESSTSAPAGFQLIGERLATLPIGSFLDSKHGLFYWQPGPGYLGDHELVFIEKIGDEMKRKLITIRIRPKFE